MNYREVKVAKFSELKDNEMKAVSVGNDRFLLTRLEGKIYAVDGNCTHYGAPLEEGVLCRDTVICPWHHSYFNVKTGKVTEPPAFNSLNKYDVIINGDDVILRLPESIEAGHIPEMSNFDQVKDSRVFVIIGAGAAGYAAAQTLREDNFRGRVVMITYEKRLPYDRPNLSKEYLMGSAPSEWMPLRPDDFFQKYGIELMQERMVREVNVNSKTIIFEDRGVLSYDRLLVATGGVPRKLEIPGSELNNIFYLRTFDDCDRIISTSENSKRAVIIGSSFIGMEAAYSLRKRKLSVTVVSPDSVPFEKAFGSEVGQLFLDLHKSNGVGFRLKTNVTGFEGKGGTVKSVSLSDGEKLEADFVLVGIGVSPATDFLKGLRHKSDGSLRTDQFFRVSEDIFAAGDIVTFPDFASEEFTRIEHWRVAEQMGRNAAHNMLGNVTPNTIIPFFWTHQAGLEMRYVGHATGWDEIVIKGNVKAEDFIAFYIKNNQVKAALGNKHDKEMAAVEELMRLERMPTGEEIKKDSIDLLKLIQQLNA